VTTDLSKREKLARALAKAIHEYKGYANWNDVDNLKQVRLDGEWDMFVLVDAFLAELREPDEGMLDAADRITPRQMYESRRRGSIFGSSGQTKAIWQAMLDEVK